MYIKTIIIFFLLFFTPKTKATAMYDETIKAFSEKMYNRCISDLRRNNIKISNDSKDYCHCCARGIYEYFINDRELFYNFSDIIAREKLGYKITDNEINKIIEVKEYFDKKIIDICLKKHSNSEEIKKVQAKKYIDDMKKAAYNMCLNGSNNYPKYYREKACECMSEVFENEFKKLYQEHKETFETFLLLSAKLVIIQNDNMSDDEKRVYKEFSLFYEDVFKKVQQYCN